MGEKLTELIDDCRLSANARLSNIVVNLEEHNYERALRELDITTTKFEKLRDAIKAERQAIAECAARAM